MRVTHSVVVCGRICSGKSSVVKFLAERFSFSVVSFGSLIRHEVTARRLEHSRGVYQETGFALFASLGARGLLEAACKDVLPCSTDRVVFDGVRHRSVLTEVRQVSERVVVVGLHADELTRYQRYKARRGTEAVATLSFGAFQALDRHPIEEGVEELMREADILLDTSGPLEIVCRKLTEGLCVRGVIEHRSQPGEDTCGFFDVL